MFLTAEPSSLSLFFSSLSFIFFIPNRVSWLIARIVGMCHHAQPSPFFHGGSINLLSCLGMPSSALSLRIGIIQQSLLAVNPETHNWVKVQRINVSGVCSHREDVCTVSPSPGSGSIEEEGAGRS